MRSVWAMGMVGATVAFLHAGCGPGGPNGGDGGTQGGTQPTCFQSSDCTASSGGVCVGYGGGSVQLCGSGELCLFGEGATDASPGAGMAPHCTCVVGGPGECTVDIGNACGGYCRYFDSDSGSMDSTAPTDATSPDGASSACDGGSHAITEYPLPSNMFTYPAWIAAGPDGNLWFTWQFAGQGSPGNGVGRMTPTGVVTQFSLPTPGSQAEYIVLGSDGHLWTTEYQAAKLARIATDGTATEYPVPTSGSLPNGIAPGPSGTLWFTEESSGKVGWIATTGGAVTELSPPTPGSHPSAIVEGSDGNLWFCESSVNQIGRVSPGGSFTEFPVPTPNAGPKGITLGADGNVWFTESGADKIGKITPSGVVTEFSIPTANSGVFAGIAAGPDGNVWFSESSKIGRIAPSGAITEFPLPTANAGAAGLVAGPDGSLWFTEVSANRIGRVALCGNSGGAPDASADAPPDSGRDAGGGDAGTSCVVVLDESTAMSPTCGCVGLFLGCPAATATPGGSDFEITVNGVTTQGFTNGASYACEGVTYAAAYCATTEVRLLMAGETCFLSDECETPLSCSSGCAGTEPSPRVCSAGVCE